MNLYQPTISGSLVVSGSVSVIGPFTMSGGSITGTASFASNSGLLSNLDSGSFVGTGSYNTLSSSFTTVSSSYSAASGSFSTRVSTLETASGSFSGRVTKIEGNYATTGSNIFLGAQTVCANITSTGTIIAQTLNVQQVTSSIVYSSGSNTFGCDLANVQQFTGSVRITGSLNTVGIACFSNAICSCATSTIYSYFDGQNTVLPNPTDRPHLFRIVNGGLGISANNEGVSSQPIRMYTCGQERLTIAVNGNIGIGNNSPCAAIHISNANPYIYLTDTSTNGTRPTARIINGDVGTCQSLTFGFSCNDGTTCGLDVFAINEKGNVGIGTTTPNYVLDISGSAARVRNSGGSADFILDRATTSAGATYQYTTNGSLKWYTGLRGLVNDNFYIFNNSTSTNTLILDVASNAATFACSLTANQITSNYVSGSLPAMFRLCDGNGGTDAKWWMIETRSTSGNDKWYAVTSLNDAQNAISYGMRIHATNNTVDQVLFPNGNVGIGTSTPNFALEVCKTDGSVRFGTSTRHVLFCTQTATGNISYTGFRYDDNGLVEVVKLLNNYSGTGYGNAIGFYGNGDKQMGYIKMSQTDSSNTQAKMVVGVRCNDGAYDAFTVFPGAITCFAATVCAPNLITTGTNSSVRGGDSAFFRGSTVTQSGNSITFDAFRFLNPTGGVGGSASALSGRLYMTFQDTNTGGNQVSYEYLIFTTGNGISPGPYCFVQLYCGPVRGTNPISAISLVNDGSGGAVKVQATTASATVGGAVAYITYVGTAV